VGESLVDTGVGLVETAAVAVELAILGLATTIADEVAAADGSNMKVPPGATVRLVLAAIADGLVTVSEAADGMIGDCELPPERLWTADRLGGGLATAADNGTNDMPLADGSKTNVPPAPIVNERPPGNAPPPVAINLPPLTIVPPE